MEVRLQLCFFLKLFPDYLKNVTKYLEFKSQNVRNLVVQLFKKNQIRCNKAMYVLFRRELSILINWILPFTSISITVFGCRGALSAGLVDQDSRSLLLPGAPCPQSTSESTEKFLSSSIPQGPPVPSLASLSYWASACAQQYFQVQLLDC